MRRPRRGPLLTLNTASLVMIVAILLLMVFKVQAKVPENAAYIGSSSCTDCHDELSESFHYNIHRVGIKHEQEENISCESCHGPGSAHVENADPELIFSFTRDYSPDEPSPCQDCHKGYPPAFLSEDHHPETDNGCTDCHQIHSQNPGLVKKEREALCFDCHMETMAQFRMPSHHPIREGFLQCIDCHSPHGKKSVQFVGLDERETCLGCHSEKQGSFIFEHAPVNEDCKICHNPHGSVADNLLVQAEPFLCLSCHPMHFHSTLTGFAGEFTAPQHTERGGISTKDGFKRAMLTKCTQCHSEIHGSDLPSQSISGHGSALTR